MSKRACFLFVVSFIAIVMTACGTGPYTVAPDGVRDVADVVGSRSDSKVRRVNGAGGQQLNQPCDNAYRAVKRWLEDSCGLSAAKAEKGANTVINECISGEFRDGMCDETRYQCRIGDRFLKVRKDGKAWTSYNGECESTVSGTTKTTETP